MHGAILGDIAGSRFEFSHPAKFKPKKEDCLPQPVVIPMIRS